MNDGEWAKLPSSLTPYVLSQLSALHDHKRERKPEASAFYSFWATAAKETACHARGWRSQCVQARTMDIVCHADEEISLDPKELRP